MRKIKIYCDKCKKLMTEENITMHVESYGIYEGQDEFCYRAEFCTECAKKVMKYMGIKNEH